MPRTVLEVCELTVHYPTRGGYVTALRDVSLALEMGAALGVVGESGSGKSTLALAVLGLLPRGTRISGSIRLDGKELVGASSRELDRVRGRDIGLVYQDALVSLNPVRTVGSQIFEVIRRHSSGTSRRAAREQAVEALARVGIPGARQRAAEYPHQFSGGMRQRAAIAMALAAQPRLLIADEVTTALDVTVQAQILELLGDLQRERGMSMVVISHDLDVVEGVTSNLAVMYAGRVVETAPTVAGLSAPRHPYTRRLVDSAPRLDSGLISFIPGAPPPDGPVEVGCSFAERCWLSDGRHVCTAMTPDLMAVDGSGAHRSACHFWTEVPASGASPRTDVSV